MDDLAQLWNWLNGQIRKKDKEIDEYRSLLKSLENRTDMSDQARRDLENFYAWCVVDLQSEQRGYEKTLVHLTENQEWMRKIWTLK